MKRLDWSMTCRALLVAGVALSPAAQADFEVTGPDGRRILLKDEGTWAYVEAPVKDQEKDQAKGQPKDKARDAGEALLRLDRKEGGASNCRFFLQLVNNLPYEIRSFVPQFSAFRKNGVMYDTVFSGFGFLKSGDSQRREIQF
jgi:hypothetical protein